jgi:hypothetical protein
MNTERRLRRSPQGGYARGERTRHRIIEAAIELFGEHGFGGAPTRDIAARAGVNAPALQYYFENKVCIARASKHSPTMHAWSWPSSAHNVSTIDPGSSRWGKPDTVIEPITPAPLARK